MFYYNMPTKVVFGSGGFDNIRNYINPFNPKGILLITGKRSMKKVGIIEKIFSLLKNYRIFLYDGVVPNPSMESLTEGIFLLKQKRINLVIGIGGGSVLDYAKAISVLVNNDGLVEDYFYKKRKLEREGIPTIAIPTSAGTSSEITPYAVMTDLRKKIKITLTDRFIYPKLAIIDPLLTLTMPPELIANSGIDALCHAIEAYWNINHAPLSDLFALKAIELISINLPKAYKQRSKLTFRENMCLGSVYAGMAFSNTGTTACHSISYPLTTIFDVPHGNACVLTLGELLQYNSKGNRDKILDICEAMGARNVVEGIKKVKYLMKSVKLKTRLKNCGIKRRDIKVIVEKAFTPERMRNNPRRLTKQTLTKILRKIY